MSEVIEILTFEEFELKNALEEVITGELQVIEASVVTLSRALTEYRDKKLYRDEYSSFAECAAKKFGIGRSRAQQLIACGKTIDALEGLPLPEGYGETPTEGQLRPISKAGIPDEDKRKVYSAAVEQAASEQKPVTGKLIEEKLAELTTQPPPPQPEVSQKPEYILMLEKIVPSLDRVVELLYNSNREKGVGDVYPGYDDDITALVAVNNRIEDVLAEYNEGHDE